MTITLPLPCAEAGPSRHTHTRAFGEFEESYNVPGALAEVVQAIRGAKRIVVICGAGVSTGARIPDFRSAEGLFSTPKQAKLRSTRSGPATPVPVVALGRKKPPGVRDLFHFDSLVDDDLLPAHHSLLNTLYEMSKAASPTPFHSFLSTLDNDGRLLRCYTQNIDGLEEKAGLEVGLPQPISRSGLKRRRINPPPTPDSRSSPISVSIPSTPSTLIGSQSSSTTLPSTPEFTSSNPISNPYPRVIPLHGLLSTAKCTFCSYTIPFAQIHPLPPHHTPCPACDHHSSVRAAKEQRLRSQGVLRAGVVLYGEEHPQGHLIGKVVERDLKGLGGKGEKEGKVDLLIVAGTSLSIPGIKRMVKEMSKTLGERGGLRRIFINDDAPSNPKEWDGVFNVWVKGDIQRFIIDYLDNPTFGILPPTPPKTPRKRTIVKVDSGLPTPISTKKPKDAPTPKEPATPSHKPVPRPRPDTPVIPARYWTTIDPDNWRRSESLTPLSESDEEGVITLGARSGVASI